MVEFSPPKFLLINVTWRFLTVIEEAISKEFFRVQVLRIWMCVGPALTILSHPSLSV
jgi:hypothetical protein